MADSTAPEKKPASPPENKEAKPGHNSKKLDFAAGARIMKGDIATLNSSAAKTRGDQAAAWKKIEDLGLNKKAAKHIQGMLGQSPATVSDYLRTFIGLMEPCGLGIIKDMVDAAEGQTSIAVPLIDSGTLNV